MPAVSGAVGAGERGLVVSTLPTNKPFGPGVSQVGNTEPAKPPDSSAPSRRAAGRSGWAGGLLGWVPADWRRLAGAGKRAWRYAGYERETAMLVLKSLISATVAWVLADYVLNLTSPAFAPFTAVLMVQATVFQSLRQSLQYLLAVMLGVGIEGGLGFALGPSVATFILMGLLALLLARWRRLGSQGSQVATAAFFAYSTFVAATSAGQRLTELGQIVLLVLLGAACGC